MSLTDCKLWNFSGKYHPDVILVEIEMAEMNGYCCHSGNGFFYSDYRNY